MDIRWDNPTALYGLWLVVPVVWLLIRAHKRRKRAAVRFAEPAMAERIMPQFRGSYPWVRGAILLAALVCLGIATARPRWGVYFEKVSRQGADVMVLLDVSKSMLSQDVAPSRLGRAKSDIRDLLQSLQGDRIGLVAFAGRPVVSCPLTADHGFYRTILDEVGPNSAPRGGTAIGDAIREAIRSMERRRDRDQALLLITDGEDHDSFPLEAAAQAAEREIKIFTIGMGDPVEGARVPVGSAGGNRSYLKHEGQEVWSKMDERLLQEMALRTEGAYVPAKTQAYDLGQVYRDHLSNLDQGEIQSEKRKRYRDRFQVFVLAALLLLLLERMIRPFRHRVPVEALATILIGFFVVAAGTGDKIEEGIALFKKGEYEKAARLFADVEVSLPDHPVLSFDRAASLQAGGDHAGAKPLYLKAASARDSKLAARAQYNMGTMEAAKARAIFGENPEEATPERREEGMGLLGQAVGRFRSCLGLNPSHEDARKNLELIRLWLKHMADVWAKKDQEKKREELDLLGFLELLMKQQQQLLLNVEMVEKDQDSPRKREATRQLHTAQKTLREEIAPLKKKIEQALKAPEGTDEEENRKKFREAMMGWADEAGKAMADAAADLDGRLLLQVREFQKEALDGLYRIWVALAPFEKVLERAIKLEQEVVEGTTPLTVDEKEGEQDSVDVSRLLRDQSRAEALSRVLSRKAEQGLERLKESSDGDQGGQEEDKGKLEGLKTAYGKAIELGPRIVELCTAAAADLDASKPKEALPKEKEALRLLKEIAEHLPKQEQDQKKEDKNDNKQDQKQNQEKGPRSQPEKSKSDHSRERAEALLRKAKEREKEYRDKKRKIEGAAQGRVQVERDW